MTNANETVLSRARAEEIRAAVWAAHGSTRGGATESEHRAILRFWDTLPGSTTYYDAVCRLAGRR